MPFPVLAGAGALILSTVARMAASARAVFTGGTMVWAFIVASVAYWVPKMVGQVLIALGVKFIVLDPLIGLILDNVVNQFALVEGSILETVYYLNVDDFLTFVLSAYGARMARQVAMAPVNASAP